VFKVVHAVGLFICGKLVLDSVAKCTCLGSLCHGAKVEILCRVNCYISGNVLGCVSVAYLDVWFRKLGGSVVQWVGFIEAGNCLLVHT
jgi:hypothetical protein